MGYKRDALWNRKKYCHSFVKDRKLDINPNISPFLDMCKYTPGGSLGVHYDGQDGDRSLLYSIVMYFNDDCEGERYHL